MGSSMSNEQEQQFAARFITALQKDISSSKHGSQTNWYVLEPAIRLLTDRGLCPQLNVEQIIRGTMNMAIATEDYKYQMLNPKLIGKAAYDFFTSQRDHWFGDYFNRKGTAVDLAVPVITRASQSSLFMVTNCVTHTLALYCEFLKEMDVQYSQPKRPKANSNYTIGHETKDNFSFEVFHQLIEKTYEEEQRFLNLLIGTLHTKVDVLKSNQNSNENTIKTAELLSDTLSNTVNVYLDSESNPKITRAYAKKQFIIEATKAINAAIPILDKELGWGEYLKNLLKTISNAFISATNAIVRSKFTLFSEAKAPMIQEVEDLNQIFKDSMAAAG